MMRMINVIAYSMSILFHHIRTSAKGYELDFMQIWNQQRISPELAGQMRILCNEVYEFITRSDRLTENVTQWCKQAKCWERAQKNNWTFKESLRKTLVSKETINSEEKEAKEERKVANEVDVLKFIMSAGTEYWKNVLEWSDSRRLLSDMEKSILKMIVNMNITGRIPSVKQAKVIVKARERLIAEGMPLQF